MYILKKRGDVKWFKLYFAFEYWQSTISLSMLQNPFRVPCCLISLFDIKNYSWFEIYSSLDLSIFSSLLVFFPTVHDLLKYRLGLWILSAFRFLHKKISVHPNKSAMVYREGWKYLDKSTERLNPVISGKFKYIILAHNKNKIVEWNQ